MIDNRVITIVLGALVINLLLFIVMERMSAQQPDILNLNNEVLSVDFVRLKRTPPPPEVNQRVKPPEKIQELLLTPQMQVPSPKPMHIQDLTMKMPRINIPMNISGVPFKGTMGAGDIGGFQEAVPLVRIPPLYPPSALSRKLEGRVKIVFTVTEDGKVIDPVVIAAKPSGIFDQAALRAIRKWKFNKRLVDGNPVQWQSVQTIIFHMDKS